MSFPRQNIFLPVIIVFVLLIGAGVRVAHLIGGYGQAIGTTDQAVLSDAQPSVNFNDTLKTVSSSVATFSYPESLQPQPTQAAKYPVLGSYYYTFKDTETWQLAVSIMVSSGGLTNDSAYRLRIDNPEEYQQSDQVINGNDFIIMTDTQAQAFSKVAFLVKSNTVATISLVGDDSTDPGRLDQTFLNVLSSWRWQQS